MLCLSTSYPPNTSYSWGIIEYMMSVCGIGWIVASQLLARIGDWRELQKRAPAGRVFGTGSQRALYGRENPSESDHPYWRRPAEKQTHPGLLVGDPPGRGTSRIFSLRLPPPSPWRWCARVAIVAVARKLSTRISVVLMQQRPYVVRQKIHSAPLTQEETSPQGTTR